MTPAAIIDCDPGHDDVMAILLAGRTLDLRAITTVHGNASVQNTTTNARKTVEFAGLELVRPGWRRHVVQEGAPPRETFDAEQLFGVQAAVRSAVLRVALAGDRASRDVVHARLASSG